MNRPPLNRRKLSASVWFTFSLHFPQHTFTEYHASSLLTFFSSALGASPLTLGETRDLEELEWILPKENIR
jgi:hypothetical protein